MSYPADLMDYRVTATRYVALVSVLVVTPFVVLHFVQGRMSLGILLSVVVLALAWAARESLRGHASSRLLFLTFVPSVCCLLAMSLLQQGITAVLWVFPTIMTFYLILEERRAWLANIIMWLIISTLSVMHLDWPTAIRVIASLLAVSLFGAILTRVIGSQQKRLHAQVVTDSLTGLVDRIVLAPALEMVVSNAQSESVDASLIILDVDYFKSINDSFGHDVGDSALKEISSTLKEGVPESATIFRLGGEEFLILLPGYAADVSELLAERIRRAIARIDLAPELTISASFGVAQYQKPEEWKSWVKRADVKLYEAKSAGRNRVVSDEGLVSSA